MSLPTYSSAVKFVTLCHEVTMFIVEFTVEIIVVYITIFELLFS